MKILTTLVFPDNDVNNREIVTCYGNQGADYTKTVGLGFDNKGGRYIWFTKIVKNTDGRPPERYYVVIPERPEYLPITRNLLLEEWTNDCDREDHHIWMVADLQGAQLVWDGPMESAI